MCVELRFNYKYMKQLLSISSKRNILILLSVVLVTIVAARFMVAEAVSIQPVGSLSVVLVPNGGDSGAEFVTLEYSGPGSANLDGWSLINSDGLVKDLTGISIPSTQVFKICEQGSGSGCDAEWTGNDVFADAGDFLELRDDTGSVSVRIDYTDSTVSTSEPGNGPYITEVYGKGDKVMVCHAEKNGGYRSHNTNASNIIRGVENDKNSHASHPDDIIPSFTHNLSGGFGYYAGQRWPDSTGLYSRGCQ